MSELIESLQAQHIEHVLRLLHICYLVDRYELQIQSVPHIDTVTRND